jgi:hypothetical protein
MSVRDRGRAGAKSAHEPLCAVAYTAASQCLKSFQTVSLGWTLAIWPCNTPHQLGLLRRPLRLSPCHSPATTRKKSP